jgi:hypothetical protein
MVAASTSVGAPGFAMPLVEGDIPHAHRDATTAITDPRPGPSSASRPDAAGRAGPDPATDHLRPRSGEPVGERCSREPDQNERGDGDDDGGESEYRRRLGLTGDDFLLRATSRFALERQGLVRVRRRFGVGPCRHGG